MSGFDTGHAPEVLIMAGGLGRRLGPLTERVPKPMLPIAGRPLLEHLLGQLREQGVRHAYLAVHHLSSAIVDHFGTGRRVGLDLDYVREDAPLGTAGALGLLPTLDRPLLLLNGDVLATIPVAGLVATHEREGAALTIGSVQHTLPVAYGVLDCDGAQVVGIREKPRLVVRAVAGVYVVAPDVVASVPAGTRLDMPDLIDATLASGARIAAHELTGAWHDIGTPATYAEADASVAVPAQPHAQVSRIRRRHEPSHAAGRPA